jgi:hypothetical protein
MATTHKLGREVLLYTLAQAAAGTAASGNFNPLHHYGFTPRRTDGYEDDPLIGRELENLVDAQEPAETQVEAGFDLDLPLCFNQIGWILPHLFRVVAPTGDDPYTHVFKTGATEHAGGSFAWQEAGDWRLADTVTWSQMEINLTPANGRRRISLQGMAGDVATPESDPTGTPAAALALNPFPGPKGCKIMLDDVVIANVTGGNVIIRRTLSPFRGAYSEKRVATEFTPEVGSRAEGSLDFRVVNNVFYDIARAKTAEDIKLQFATDADNSLTIALPNTRFVPAERAVSGPGLRTESYSFQTEQSASAAAAELTLVNSIAAYAGES